MEEDVVTAAPPEDVGNRAYWICFILGAGILFPWNAYITAVDYFETLYPGKHIDRLFGVLYFLPNLSALPFILWFGHVVSPRVRVRFGYTLFLLCLIVPSVRAGGLGLLCIAVMLTGVADASAQGSLFGVIGPMPERYTQALMGGTSFSGLIISLLRLVTKASFPDTVSGLGKSAVVYFVISALWVASCLVLHNALEKTEIYAHYRRRTAVRIMTPLTRGGAGEAGGMGGRGEDERGSKAGGQLGGCGQNDDESEFSFIGGGRGGRGGGGGDEVDVELSDGGALKRGFDGGGGGGGGGGRGGARRRDASASASATASGVWSILRDTWPHAYSVAVIYAVTLSIFPGFLAEDVSSDALGDWYPVVLITVFNLSDVVGKMSPGWFPRLASSDLLNPKLLVALSTARILFVPAFLLVTRRHGPRVLYGNEAPCVMLTLALGLTNGLYSSAAMMSGPKAVAPHQSETCGTVMVFFLLLGLAVGALCGWLWLL